MFELLEQRIQEKVTLTPEEFDQAKTFFTPKKMRKRQYLLQQDDVCKYTAFVEKGVLRSYTLDDRGNEHIIQFAFEGWWVSDIYSFLTGEPSIYNIEAIEHAELLLLTPSSNEAMLEQIPKMERYFRILSQNALISLQRRLVGSLSQSAEEKYTQLLSTYPDVVKRVPQHMIASFLGITPETLSRTRRQMLLRR